MIVNADFKDLRVLATGEYDAEKVRHKDGTPVGYVDGYDEDSGGVVRFSLDESVRAEGLSLTYGDSISGRLLLVVGQTTGGAQKIGGRVVEFTKAGAGRRAA